ncbi:Zinc-binding dehydrogenase family protein [Abeliophyllum distichum]|uniref:Zinc-binding dehydrogenase family protein n=1 Tax=Abeliophyllum distichum TaxID=126358 RepID=A0ABD1PM95_9LAMI
MLSNRYFTNGIDIYFDNVGGSMLDVVPLNMKNHGRIVVCGMVSQQRLYQLERIHNLFNLVIKSITMKRFLQSDYLHLFPKFLEDVVRFYTQGKIIYLEDVNEGLESGPIAFAGLFSGRNVGKQVICIARE